MSSLQIKILRKTEKYTRVQGIQGPVRKVTATSGSPSADIVAALRTHAPGGIAVRRIAIDVAQLADGHVVLHGSEYRQRVNHLKGKGDS